MLIWEALLWAMTGLPVHLPQACQAEGGQAIGIVLSVVMWCTLAGTNVANAAQPAPVREDTVLEAKRSSQTTASVLLDELETGTARNVVMCSTPAGWSAGSAGPPDQLNEQQPRFDHQITGQLVKIVD
mmetsp:Transcript_44817/g.87855  ORF Transcript_44817/g.87855 Transcript_44817/m.87855 type:complete len:128 (+) Transcript_44817:749-1132(+)